VAIDVQPATHARFDDVATVLGPRKPESSVCWCLSYRIPSKDNRALTGTDRRDLVESLTRSRTPPGVLAYLDGDVVGWAGVAPRADLHSFANSRRIPHVDDLPVWTIWCFRVRGGMRGKGIASALLDGAVAFARDRGAPAVEGYPVDNGGKKVDLTMAYVGTRGMFEKAGFTKAADTGSVLDGFPRVLMRLALT
jgi:GNAT superfamily N-acetyltransferase